MRKEERWRNEGMAFCIKYLEEHGNDVDGLREEIKKRGAYHMPLTITTADAHEFTDRVRMNCLDTVLLMTLGVLHDRFGFGMKRARQFVDEFRADTEMLGNDMVNWTEIQRQCKEMLHLDIPIRWSGIPHTNPSEREESGK